MVSRVDRGALLSAAGFWLRDIWGPQWDAERRARLFRHYWSYAWHHPVPAVHAPGPDAAAVAAQCAFVDRYRDRIAAVQHHAARHEAVKLTYRPIGKNLRLVGTAIRRNTDRGRATRIAPAAPAIEVAALRARGLEWHPWPWSRAAAAPGTRPTPDEAWQVLFTRPTTSERGGESIPPVPVLSHHTSGTLTGSDLCRVLKLAAATDYAFSPVPALIDDAVRLSTAIGWPEDEPVLGMHVRRGDAASSDDSSRQSNRASFPMTAYLAAAARLCGAYGIRHIFLATESTVEIDRARELRPELTFLTLPHDRSLFPDISATGQYIEELALVDPARASRLAQSAILDLLMFRKCRAFVGAFNSEFSVLAWLLTIGAQRHAVPFVSLSEPASHLRLHPHDALLNLRNNCPLELYHW